MTKPKRKLPEGWRYVRLEELLIALETGKRPQGGAVGITEGVPSLSAEHMTNQGTLDLTIQRFIPYEFYTQMPQGHIQSQDVLIVKDGATTGKTVFVDNDFPFQKAAVNEHVFLCRANLEVVIPRFLFFWLWGSEGQESIKKYYRGSAIGGISRNFAAKVLVPLPPLSEQKRIAAILNERMAGIDKARAAAQAQLKAAKALPSAYLRQVFSSPEAQKWPKKKLGEVCRLLPSKSISTVGDTVVKVITTACLSESGFLPSGIKEARMYSEDASQCLVTPGEILIARSNTPDLVGRVSMFPGGLARVFASDLTIRIQPLSSVQSGFLTAYLSTLFVSGYWKKQAGGASGSMKKIKRSQILTELVPVPTYLEQDTIARSLQGHIEVSVKIQNKVNEELETINKLPAALLGQAFRGVL